MVFALGVLQNLFGKPKIATLALLALVLSPLLAEAAEIKLEAENATRNGVTVASTRGGFSGTGYVQGFDNSFAKNVTFSVSVPATGIYDVAIRYGTPSGEKGYLLSVNGQQAEGMFPNVAAFGTAQAGKYKLNAGNNTLVLGGGWGYYIIDYITLKPATIPVPAKPTKTLTDPNASLSTRNLFSYLVDIYGSKVLAGGQETNDRQEIDYIVNHSGKEPAVGGFDLIDYSPSRLEHGANPNNFSEYAIQWAKKDQNRGIVSLMWHWNAPTDLINQSPDKLWWSGFYTRATTFDVAAALADKNGVKFQLLLRDMDAIAVQLKKFQDQDVPVLWRPLHEAAGAWFWWGAKGAEPFKELWRIMHDRFTNHHQLHNLIWVYTAERGKPEWYPGDAYVDIVGIDIYENTATASNLSSPWTELQSQFNGKKLVTLSETGNLPNPTHIRDFGTWWSWFMVWPGTDFLRKQPTSLINSVFNDPDVITLDELPDWRNYSTVTSSPAEKKSNGLSISPNPATGNVLSLKFIAETSGTAEIHVLSAEGKVVTTCVQKASPGVNEWQVPVQHITSGVYTVVVKAGATKITRKILLQR